MGKGLFRDILPLVFAAAEQGEAGGDEGDKTEGQLSGFGQGGDAKGAGTGEIGGIPNVTGGEVDVGEGAADAGAEDLEGVVDMEGGSAGDEVDFQDGARAVGDGAADGDLVVEAGGGEIELDDGTVGEDDVLAVGKATT